MTLRILSTLALSLIFAASAWAQDMGMPQQQQAEPINLSDSDIEQFVDIYIQQQEIQQEYQPKMIAVIEDEGLTVEQFQQIIQAQQMGGEADATEEELASFETSIEQIQVIEMDMMTQVEAMLEEEGMEMQEYEQMFAAIQSDPETMQKVQEKLQERMGMGG